MGHLSAGIHAPVDVQNERENLRGNNNELNEEALYLARKLMQKGPIPERAKDDALHIALATVHGMDYLLTWNCRHIANAEMRKGLTSVCMLSLIHI